MKSTETPFRLLTPEQRLAKLNRKVATPHTPEELALLQKNQPELRLSEALIENSIGYFSMPLGVASGFVIDGREVWIPMAVEETSIIAAASATAKWVGAHGGVRTWLKGVDVIGQVQLPEVRQVERVLKVLEQKRAEILSLANQAVPGLVRRGGGFKELRVRVLKRPDLVDTSMVVLDLICDPCDAMGANLLNQACESLKAPIGEWTEERVGLCILSNLTDTRVACAEIRIQGVEADLGKKIVEATLFACLDPYRAATHNKGVMNGIDAVLLATGNDWRAVEAGVHAFASRSGVYQPLTQWRYESGELIGNIEAPLALGTVGGVTRLHPAARFSLSLMGIESSAQLSRICAAVGLVQNLGALKALCTMGIVRGHMRLHASNLALAAGADFLESPEVVRELEKRVDLSGQVTLGDAHEVLSRLRSARVDSTAANFRLT